MRLDNAALKAEIELLQNSFRVRAANLLAQAVSSPRGALLAPRDLLQLVRDFLGARSWRRLVTFLECGLPDDPLRHCSTSNFKNRKELLRLVNLAGANKPPTQMKSLDPRLSSAQARFTELFEIAQNGPPQPQNSVDANLRAETINQEKSVLMVLHTGQPDHSNGYARRSHELLRELNAGDYRVSCGLRAHAPETTGAIIDGVSYERLPYFTPKNDGYIAYTNAYAQAIGTLIKSLRPSIVHAASNHVSGYAAGLAARNANLPFFYEVRGLWEVTRASVEPIFEGSTGYAAQQTMEHYVATMADRLLVNGKGLMEYFEAAGVDKDKIINVPNGCLPEEFDVKPEKTAMLGKKFRLDDRPVIGFVGSITPYEGLHTLVEACALLRDLPFQLLIIGDGPFLPQLRRQIMASPIADRSRLIGRVSPDTAKAAYSLIDIAPITRSDTPVGRLTPPLKPLDAMSGRSALIVTDLPALRGFAIEDRGLIVPPNDNHALSEALRILLKDTALRARVTRRARQHVERQSRWRFSAAEVSQAYDTVLSEKSL